MSETICLKTWRELSRANDTAAPAPLPAVTLTGPEAEAVSQILGRMMDGDYAVAATMTLRPAEALTTARAKLAASGSPA